MTRLILLCLVTVLAACSEPPPRFAPLPPGTPVLAFGDSVTHGTGAGRGEDFPALLEASTGWRIVNAGIPGDRADTARRRIDEALASARPDLVLIKLGGNDFLARRPHADVKEDLRALIHRVRASGAQPVLVAVPALSPLGAALGRLRDAGLYAELAREEDVPLVADVFSEVLSDGDLRADPVHPNAAGYRRLAQGIARSLRSHGLLPAP